MAVAVIKEGFICAECHDQFNSVEALLTHYQSRHPTTEDSKSIRGLIEKTKTRLLVNATKQQAEAEYLRLTPKYFDLYEDVTLGKSCSHFDYFKKIRSLQVERYSSEANRLLIRLQKIMKFEGDESKRRVHEQEIVAWVEEKHVPRCPDCTQNFNLLLRRHHCRLCGSIQCEDCSSFLPPEIASALLSQMTSAKPGSEPPPDPTTPATATPPKKPEYKIRTCTFCLNLLLKKHQTLSNASSSRAIITQFYDRLRSLQSQCSAKNAEYNEFVSSLGLGEKLHSIEQCIQRRNEMIKLTEKIDGLSKKIIVLGTESGEGISETEKRLRGRIRAGTVNWIREFLAGIKALPTEEEAVVDDEVYDKGQSPSQKKRKEPVVKIGTNGWTPSQGNKEEEGDDVLEIQITNMKRWIDEARADGKLDEVEMMEANLTELLQFRYNMTK